ncbi:hypothetical protein NC796_21190 [Aliifodinibius sp. S!AR15-10]|uniref:hypothetical protein n=1 Tax=Aliifodinibius sp. S!AR15-10 TaxID=2950437 RepID=UPI002855486D|nr:hypothetical protein [Aliifodinibius sp. S!AR15-10]MDR8393683.1 hypothetical protein [Aliifodinibius sp. S!AR15-10]
MGSLPEEFEWSTCSVRVVLGQQRSAYPLGPNALRWDLLGRSASSITYGATETRSFMRGFCRRADGSEQLVGLEYDGVIAE